MIEREEDRKAAGLYERAFARIEQRSAPEPTRERTPQRESSGQFAPAERPTGREAEERAAGYKPLKEERSEPEGLTVHDAAVDRAKAIQERPIEVHESGLKDNVTLSAEQAAKRIAESREADAKQAELDGTKAAQKAVDELRNPHGVEIEPRQPQLQTEPDIETVLKHPKVSAALAERVTAAETQRQQFEAAARRAGTAEVAAIAADFPELMNLPLENWVPAIQAMHQREPARAVQVAKRIQSFAQIVAEVEQFKAQKEAGAKVEFTKYSARENQRFVELTKGIPPQQMAAIRAEVPAMLAEVGVTDPHTFLKSIEGQNVFPRASAEMIMLFATRYLMMQKAAKPAPARAPLPPVQRPGVAQNRSSSASANLAALNAKLSATGDIKDATALLMAKRRGKR